MQRIIILVVSVLISGCTMHYSKVAVPVLPESRGQYQIIKHMNQSSTGFRLFTLGSGAPSAIELINDAVKQAGGDGIINTEISFSEAFLGPFSFPKVKVSGDVVRLFTKTAVVSQLRAPTQTIDLLTPTPEKQFEAKPVETQNTRNTKYADSAAWKSAIRALKRENSIYDEWWGYLRRTRENISYETWVSNLTDQDFVIYTQSGDNLLQWVQKRLISNGK
jgi:hypothetical protein